MMMKEYISQLEASRVSSSAEIVVIPFFGHFVGLTKSNDLVILFNMPTGRVAEPEIGYFPNYEHIQLRLNEDLTVESKDGLKIQQTFSILLFKSRDSSIRIYFLNFIRGLIEEITEDRGEDSLLLRLKQALSLFRLIGSKPRIEIQGLWAELFLINLSSESEKIASSWHCENNDLWDFHCEEWILEVKSTVKTTRGHVFNNDQILRAKVKNNAMVASVLLSRTKDGPSIWDLFDSISKKISIEESSRMKRLIYELLGNQLAVSLEYRFDLEYALSNLKFFEFKSLPFIDAEIISPVITKISYTLTLDGITPLKNWYL